ncbi:MAG TPA: hypothetical protein VM074_12410 [Solimonas sp.]|nr:hypothetical protein [Solimonas sp.]
MKFVALSTVVLTCSLVSPAALSAPPNGKPTGLEFSSPLTDDLQRGAGEPIIEIDKDGTVYTCGPTGFSQNQDYASVSLDFGDQFNPIGQYPRGQFSAGGGGDCAFATGPVKSPDGYYPFAYTGLYGLVSFCSAVSPDRGATIEVGNTTSLPGLDRQWVVFSDADTVFHTYNRLAAPAGLTVQRSDDSGLSYGSESLVSPGSSGQGQIRSMPAELNPAKNGKPVVYYPWSAGAALRLALSLDEGATWNNCTVWEALGNTANKFPAADHDSEGNLYFAYTEEGSWDAFVTTVPNAELLNCTGGVAGGGESLLDASEPVQVNRDTVETTAFPWLVASGLPGRVAVSFYGSQVDGAPDDASLPHVWDVYVSQSLNALDGDKADFYQVKASSHPMHYDQICQNGLGCTTGGDRSLVDFFAIDFNPANGELLVVYNWAHKRPDDPAGLATATVVIRQVGGPSHNGGEIDNPARKALRQATSDPQGDAYTDFSDLFVTGTRGNSPAMDVTNVEVLPPVNGDGLTVRMQLADLSDGALQDALLDLPAQSLLWIFYYVDGYRYHAASARWNPAEGFTFGHNGYEGSLQECGAPPSEDPTDPLPPEGQNPGGATGPDQCVYYRGTTPLNGRVDQATGTIEIDLPLEMLSALKDVAPPARSPAEMPAQPGDRIFSAAVYTQGNSISPTQMVQSWLTPVDNTASMDFLVPGGAPAPAPVPAPVPVPDPVPAPAPPPDTGAEAARFGGGLPLATLALLALGAGLRRARGVAR